MNEKILILDFGSQYTQLIARRIRELNVYCEIYPFNKPPVIDSEFKGVILSGSPFSVRDEKAPKPDLSQYRKKMPLLGVCYGAQLMAEYDGGNVNPSKIREYGRANLNFIDNNSLLFKDISLGSQVWMSHGDTITQIPNHFQIISGTTDVKVAGFKIDNEETYGIQFHPEVYHSTDGLTLLKNFIYNICGCSELWTPSSFIDTTIKQLQETIGNDKVVLGLSGGVDSTVAAVLLNKAIGKNLYCIFVDNGLLRKNEFESVLHSYKDMGLNVKGVNAGKLFLDGLKDVVDPEKKRKIIGRTFIEVFDKEASRVGGIKWLAQGTIYPDVIESISVHGPSATIKSHHNVGGLPDYMKLKVVEPLKSLFKDEVRRIGKALGISKDLIGRHPFPGPGLAIRILSDVTEEKVRILQEVDYIFIQGLKNYKLPSESPLERGNRGVLNESAGARLQRVPDLPTSNSELPTLYDAIWQAAAMLLPVQSVGVMGDERTYQNVVALRAVTSTDGMTADWAQIPYDFLAFISNEIINKVKGINRVVYDISSKPPATIEWE